jgi:hypothetical protein
MSLQTPEIGQARAAIADPNLDQIRIVSHCTLFYWWPVWAVGFVLAFLTYADPHRLAIVPDGTRAEQQRIVEGFEKEGPVDVLILPRGKELPRDPATNSPLQPSYHMSAVRSYGVLFTLVLLLVIAITNIPLRGLWSVVVIVLVLSLSVIFALAHYQGRNWWEHILEALGSLHIFQNFAGYFVFSLGLFGIWLITLVFFDPRMYMVFRPGQLRVRQEIGGGETAYDTAGMVVQKQRNDLFRHWFLGLGSGDLVVNTSGANARHIDLPNVLFVGYKVRRIENMLREKQVVQGR